MFCCIQIVNCNYLFEILRFIYSIQHCLYMINLGLTPTGVYVPLTLIKYTYIIVKHYIK